MQAEEGGGKPLSLCKADVGLWLAKTDMPERRMLSVHRGMVLTLLFCDELTGDLGGALEARSIGSCRLFCRFAEI